jgi:hypothetical protein
MTTSVKRFRPRQLLLAVTVGVAGQVVLLAFAVHGSLALSLLSFGNSHLYWGFAGAYMVLCLAASLLVFPWHRGTVRIAAALLTLTPFFVFGLVFHWN